MVLNSLVEWLLTQPPTPPEFLMIMKRMKITHRGGELASHIVEWLNGDGVRELERLKGCNRPGRRSPQLDDERRGDAPNDLIAPRTTCSHDI